MREKDSITRHQEPFVVAFAVVVVAAAAVV